ncbi:MAG: hypothetical protein L0Y44_13895 [Phycisphaerales bacterium]|nr:hypothetical protein [Phycisphaerales bacterium]
MMHKWCGAVAVLGVVHLWFVFTENEPAWMRYGPVPWIIFVLVEAAAGVMWYIGERYWVQAEAPLKRVDRLVQHGLKVLESASRQDDGQEWLESMDITPMDRRRLQSDYDEVQLLTRGSRKHLMQLGQLAHQVSALFEHDHLLGQPLEIDAMMIDALLGLRPMSEPVAAMMAQKAQSDQYLRSLGVDPEDYADAIKTGNQEKLRTIFEWAVRNRRA